MPLIRNESSSSSLPSSSIPREEIARLQAHIRRIEGRGHGFEARVAEEAPRWTLGISAVDQVLGGGLEVSGLHEVRPQVAGGRDGAALAASCRSFALLLAMRRLLPAEAVGPVLWCHSPAMASEHGKLYARGLMSLGLDPARLLIVTPRRTRDMLWVVEEAVKASCLTLVVGEVGEVGVTAARRLSLAAGESHTPCLLIAGSRSPPVISAATRWRVAPRRSGLDDLDPAAPGSLAFDLALERCRARPLVAGAVQYEVEWCNVARRFRLAAMVPDRAVAPQSRAGPGQEHFRRSA